MDASLVDNWHDKEFQQNPLHYVSKMILYVCHVTWKHFTKILEAVHVYRNIVDTSLLRRVSWGQLVFRHLLIAILFSRCRIPRYLPPFMSKHKRKLQSNTPQKGAN